MLSNYPQIYADAIPKVIKEAVKLLGVEETIGGKNNPVILDWAKEVEEACRFGKLGYTADSIPWCGLFVSVVAVRAGYATQVPHHPLWAQNWRTFGVKSNEPSLGDVLVFQRPGGGHVGFYVAEDDEAFHVLGGNQSDKVCITRVAKDRMIETRSCPFKVRPLFARPFKMSSDDDLSHNEK